MGVAPVIEYVVPTHQVATEDVDAGNKYGQDEKGKGQMLCFPVRRGLDPRIHDRVTRDTRPDHLRELASGLDPAPAIHAIVQVFRLRWTAGRAVVPIAN
jgi:hypothetical protein